MDLSAIRKWAWESEGHIMTDEDWKIITDLQEMKENGRI